MYNSFQHNGQLKKQNCNNYRRFKGLIHTISSLTISDFWYFTYLTTLSSWSFLLYKDSTRMLSFQDNEEININGLHLFMHGIYSYKESSANFDTLILSTKPFYFLNLTDLINHGYWCFNLQMQPYIFHH